ncbi:hypothetical protein GCM10008018_06750 [Paenibacillus marchantiophytorum]|uniref:YqbQ/XkdQ domain-containing protein n=1 Tax=Paenibacillus marchantiophytorum TaxID=1619310 RepID=A0ABQ2BP88_9BACL|nr:hypothetical protein [Paenibacillus marchantiophytorum]GGI44367.1 hypothetical protein GCM10008018_06750 [Paenibacillus marchantiophytorum]
MLTVEIDNKDGNMWELPISAVQFSSTRYGKPSSCSITMLRGGWYEDNAFKYNNGDVVRVRLNGNPVFYGYIFSIESGRDEEVKLTAYDQLRYLMYNETYVFKDAKASEVIKQIAGDLKLQIGEIEDSGYVIPSIVEDGTKLMDIICKALDKTLISTKKIFVLYDDFGSLRLRDADKWVMDFALGDVSLVYDYSFNRSIDTDTYNRIKIVRDNKETNKREVYIDQDSNNIAKWGRLQQFRKVEDKMNEAQIMELLKLMLGAKNRETKTFSLNAIGDIRIRAGCRIFINIEEAGISQFFQVEDCTHNFEGSEHTMKLDLKVVS